MEIKKLLTYLYRSTEKKPLQNLISALPVSVQLIFLHYIGLLLVNTSTVLDLSV